MADDKTNRGAQDRARIDVHEEHELRYWTGKFGVDADTLRAAVKAVGVSVSSVQAHLSKQKAPTRA